MGRPSVAVERRRQILDATLRCLGQYGVAGTTLDRIAEEAGMSRGHIRHFAGNRDEVLTEAARVFYLGEPADDDGTVRLFERSIATLDEAVDYLFGEFIESTDENAVALAIVEAARTMPAIHDIVTSAYDGVQSALVELLAAEAPAATEQERAAVAYGLLSIGLGTGFLTDIEPSIERPGRARAAADRLVAGLREGTR
jgi:TetR/AcrR family transcriptional regulator, transcriptional repressor of bet genes